MTRDLGTSRISRAFHSAIPQFADVVHSMDIASAVGAERLREIMTDLVDRASAVVQRYDVLRLRALLARAHGDETGHRDYRVRYRAMAKSLGFEGHIKWAEAME